MGFKHGLEALNDVALSFKEAAIEKSFRKRFFESLFQNSVLWVASFFVALLFSAPFRFFSLLFELGWHGASMGRSALPAWDASLLGAWLFTPSMILWLLRLREKDSFDRIFFLGIQSNDPLFGVSKKRSSCCRSCGRCMFLTLHGWWLGFACAITSGIPFFGSFVAFSTQFFLLMQSLNIQYAFVLSLLSWLASPRLLVYILVSSKSIGASFFAPYVFSRLEEKERRRATAKHVTDLLLFGMFANLIMLIPLVGGAACFALVQSAAGFFYRKRFSYLFVAGKETLERVSQATEEHLRLINLAYRSPKDYGKSWTGEGHLITGPRMTSVDALNAELQNPEIQMFESRDASGTLLGSIKIQHSAKDRSVEIGLFNVDPACQGQGVGGRLFHFAEKQALIMWPDTSTFLMWVLERRHELIAWYSRMGFQMTSERVPFPAASASVGRPTDEAVKQYQGQVQFAVMKKQVIPRNS